MRIYGPYKAKDGRFRCLLIYPNGKRQTVSYPRMIMERHLGRPLSLSEEVHHKDENVSNNDISNLEVISSKEHRRNHHLKYKEAIEVPCVYCGTVFSLSPLQQRYRAGNKKYGPFCSRVCSGKYGTDVQRARK